MPTKPLRIAIIADIHHGDDRGSKKGTAAKRLFGQFSRWLSRAEPDILVDLGDRISDMGADADRELQEDVTAWMKKIKIPRYHIAGNHDLDSLSLSENEGILGEPLYSRSVVVNGWRLIFWAVDARLTPGVGFSAPQSDLTWLKTELKQKKIPTIIFTHVPLSNGSFVGNFYFEKAFPHVSGYPVSQGEKIREIIEKSETVVMCLNGHAHWNAYQCIDGIHYVTVPALTELFPTYPLPSASWTMLDLRKNVARLEVLGNLPIAYDFKLKKLNHHWLNIHKTYAPKGARPR